MWRRTTRFKKDVRLAKRRGKDLSKLRRLLDALIEGGPLDLKYRDHSLLGSYSDCRERHIDPDWIVIYRFDSEHALVFERTGSHSDLFK